MWSKQLKEPIGVIIIIMNHLFTDEPSVYYVVNRESSEKKRCNHRLKKKGSRCQNKTNFIDKNFRPVCGVHLNKYDRMVCIAEFRMSDNRCHTQRVLRETTMRDELQHFSERHQCSVCLNEIKANSSVVTPCDHFFHQDCLSEWLYTANTCPLCRTFLKESEAIEMTIDLPETEELYSVLDVIEGPETRRRIREANIRFLIDRVHSYDVAVNLAGFFHSI